MDIEDAPQHVRTRTATNAAMFRNSAQQMRNCGESNGESKRQRLWNNKSQPYCIGGAQLSFFGVQVGARDSVISCTKPQRSNTTRQPRLLSPELRKRITPPPGAALGACGMNSDGSCSLKYDTTKPVKARHDPTNTACTPATVTIRYPALYPRPAAYWASSTRIRRGQTRCRAQAGKQRQ